ncbi:Crp/Fnr family transcriptional regulator [uncultured Clostridium sp.]|uniref:Crp/Fnr family transcriptional regulator n=1 Tax=uncultured Clostridium sp. TaxID=59620 RepID=UPI00261BCEB6|nr:Crp/Fnr family transcriptional regulator [uncultured Clostridium sp.]
MDNYMLGRKELADSLLYYPSRKVAIKRGEILFLDEYSDQKIAIVTDGIINYNNSLKNGKEISLGCYSSGAIIFLSGVFQDTIPNPQAISSFNITASHGATLEFISNETFTNIISKNEELVYKLLKFYGVFYEKNFYQLRDIQLLNTEDAILSILVRAYNTYGIEENNKFIISKKIFNTSIAKCLDVTEETVSRTLSSLRKEGILDKKNGLFIINDLNYVRERIGCLYCKQQLCYL